MENPETKRFGRYEVVGELGRGAMGVVYKARDPQIDRLVAVKTVSLWGQEPDEEKEFRLRFMNEAQAAGRLHHSGIVGVFDVGENPENRDPYIVLEFVAGESLNRILSREKKLPLDYALQLAIEIAEALDYAHAQGVIHRDIKPANILITQDGHAKIADFGIAKLNLAHFTLPGRVLGTPAYMAPEQLSGEGCDGRSDLFSLGVILYAIVTGHSPFQGNSATTVCFKVANREPIAASALDMTLPPDLDAVINRAMAKNPDDRYQRGSEFAEDLRQLQQIRQPGLTNTSHQTALRTGTRSGVTRTGKTAVHTVAPVAVVSEARSVVRQAFLKAPLRDLILGAATVVLLVILGTQSKLLVNASKAGMPAGAPAASAVAVTPTQAVPEKQETKQFPAEAANTQHSRKKRVESKTHEAKQIVVPSSTLDLAVQHQFKNATLYVWVDDKLALTRALHGGEQRKLVVFGGIHGVDSESLKIPAGKHTLRFRALTADQTVDLAKTVSADFIGGDTKSLMLTFDKHNTGIHVSWE
ncbi:MAG TPA: serine/threonine-protein kinase [Candidatus Sulfotelmatobacter sp.]|nr:serine/threonine-protein kinase [Candidatus Sulfotelmatobacter sp.]